MHVSSADNFVFLRCSRDPVCYCSAVSDGHMARKLYISVTLRRVRVTIVAVVKQ